MTSSRIPESHGDEAPTATDVIAFGHVFGRVLSDGQILGRAEPFAKVFPSSRAVKRAVGLIAWAVLEDIALDAHIDERGRLVADSAYFAPASPRTACMPRPIPADTRRRLARRSWNDSKAKSIPTTSFCLTERRRRDA